MKGLWRDVKRFLYLIWTAHLGGGVDLLLRQVSQITILPRYCKTVEDCVGWDAEPGDTVARVIDNMHYRVADVVYPKVCLEFGFYERWD